MQFMLLFALIAILFTHLLAYNDLKNTGTIADALADNSEHGDDNELKRELCYRCRLREHRDCNTDKLQCSVDCLIGFSVDSQTGICRLDRDSDEDTKEFMPTEELERVWSREQKKSHETNNIVSTRMTLQRVAHTKDQDHNDKLKQLDHILTQEHSIGGATSGGGGGGKVSSIDLIPPQKAEEFKPSMRHQSLKSMSDIYFIVVVAGCVSAALFGLVIAGICWYRFQKNLKASSDADYPSYGITGPTKNQPPTADEINAMSTNPAAGTDRKLAQSAQMYHYQHQKQQMLNVEKSQNTFNKNQSDSEDENEDGDYTVYECPGLAPTGEMEVNNPLFGGHLDSDEGQDTGTDVPVKEEVTPPTAPTAAPPAAAK